MNRPETFHQGQRAVIVKQLKEAKSFILVAVAYFTDEGLFDLLLKRAQEGIKVQLIVRDDEINVYSGIDYSSLTAANGEFLYNKCLHHKFCVIDGTTVLSGSYNWTYQAQRNHEDLTIFFDIQHAAEYMTTFFKIKEPLRAFRRSSMQDKSRGSGDSKERLSGILKKIEERRRNSGNKQ